MSSGKRQLASEWLLWISMELTLIRPRRTNKENTAKWSSAVTDSTSYTEEDESYIYNGTSFSPEYFEPYERLEAEHGGWSKPRNLATEMEAHRTPIVFVFLFMLLS